jgi:hypothetical protein
MTLNHKKEFMLLFLNIVLVSSQIMQLICLKTLFFLKVCYYKFLNNALRIKSVLKIKIFVFDTEMSDRKI